MIYLDTHVVIWLYGGMVEKLSARAKELINANATVVSPLVQLELQYLFEIKKIVTAPDKILTTLKTDIGLESKTSDLVDLITQSLVLTWTRDPFDRLITAQALLDKSVLLTKDPEIRKHVDLAVWD